MKGTRRNLIYLIFIIVMFAIFIVFSLRTLSELQGESRITTVYIVFQLLALFVFIFSFLFVALKGALYFFNEKSKKSFKDRSIRSKFFVIILMVVIFISVPQIIFNVLFTNNLLNQWGGKLFRDTIDAGVEYSRYVISQKVRTAHIWIDKLPEEDLKELEIRKNAGEEELKAGESLYLEDRILFNKDGIVWEITLSEEEKNFLYNVNETHNRFFKDSLFRKKASQIFAIISIFIISVFIFVLSFWIAGFLGKDLILPIENLMLGTEELKRGNYRFKIQKTSEDELGVLIDNFNKMSSIIQTARDEQSKLNENLQTERDFQNAILTSVTTGIGIISAKGDMIFKNPSLEAILKELESPEELEKSISKMLSDKDETLLKKRIRIGDIFLSINILNFRSGKSEKLLIVDDFTEILNLRRAEIWQAMARKLMHELKNPLTPISLAIDRLRRKRSQDPAGFEKIFDENTAIIKEEIDRLSKLLKHFNDFAKLPAPHLKKMSLEKLLGDLIKLYSDKEDKNVSIHLRTEADDAMIEGDQILLKQLFVNLLNNSLDSFKGGKGAINILLKGDERTVYVEFSDNGIGIAKKDLDKIWDIYFSGKKSGTGLGLTMVQRIIEDHSGRISVRSSLKTGTVFDIEFRRRQ